MRFATKPELVLALAAAMLGVAVAVADDFNPYQIPVPQFTARVQTIAIRPIDVPGDVPDPDALRATLETLVTERLRDKGYEVVPSTVWSGVWQQMSERLGGTYDVVTGKPRPDQYKAAFDHTARELERTHGVDALLSPYVTVAPAPFGRGFWAFETWGETLRINGQHIGPDIWQAPQSVHGAYMNLVIEDLAGTKLYSISYGIDWSAVFVARGYGERPLAEVYGNADRIRHAVDETLEPLAAARAKEQP